MGLLALGAGLLGGVASYFGQKETNAANKQMNEDNNLLQIQLAKENRDFQERMSNTAHQREADDLKAAGLNRILTATGGSGASAPTGNVATTNAAKMENVLGSGVSSALASANLYKDLEMANSQKALNASAIDLQATQKNVNTATAMKAAADTDVSLLTRYEKGLRNEALESQLEAVKEQAQADLKRARIDNKMVEYDAIQTRAKNAIDTAGSVKDLVNPFKGILNGPGKNIPPAGEIFKNRRGQEGFYDSDGKFHKTN